MRYRSARVRLAVAAAAGLAGWVLSAFFLPWEVAVLIGWDAMSLWFLVWAWVMIRRSDSADTARRARIEDPSRALADLVLVSACLASLVGVLFAFGEASRTTGAMRGLITTVAVLTVVLSWLTVHALYTFRYADLFYTSNGGIEFPDGQVPDYGDFAYVAFTIGMTYQVSDTSLASQAMRRNALRHALLSYVFGVAVIAVTINVVADLLRR
jgi:uncharacterized membrane protein